MDDGLTLYRLACLLAGADEHDPRNTPGELGAMLNTAANQRNQNKKKQTDDYVASIPESGSDNCRTPIDGEPAEVEPPLTLPESFWTARPMFEHIRQAARARRVSPIALLGHTLARVAAYTPPAYCVPAFVGGVKPLTLFVAQVAESGGGKSSPAQVVDDLIAEPLVGVDCVTLATGQGIAGVYLEKVKEKDHNGDTVTHNKQTRYGVFFDLDEGSALKDLSDGTSTLIPALQTLWTGARMGAALADIEKRRKVAAKNYTAGVVLLFQPDNARILFDHTSTGLPQRFLFVQGLDPDAPDIRPPFPGPLPWDIPPHIAIGGKVQHQPLTCHPDIETEVDENYVKKLRGNKVETLDAHRYLHRLKIAGLFVILDARRDITLDDWALAETLLTYSDTVRAKILKQIRETDNEKEQAADYRAARRVLKVEEKQEERAFESAVRAISRKTARSTQPVTGRELSRAIAGKDRLLITLDDVILEAIRRRHISRNENGDYTTGKSPL
jgi:hypothetical protein